MPILRDMALTVQERAPGQFHWVLLEAFEGHHSDALHYRRWRVAPAPQHSYSSALALGVAELRRMGATEDATG
ncbi:MULTISPECIES: hypothetical protein [unclassified Variovorax]|uniref:hypothetical protein n=1 Tax=unclassified Variovorax TaxID=663243 RepID=UPI0025789908|nr:MULTISPECIES: hypothetical protein [unclassified Variovorax]MDM0086171.1 hypothetical protein [Variovorax sp. J22G40]MDM0145572.1 hypothetical protein [Variovorax sp. J2P1-31]